MSRPAFRALAAAALAALAALAVAPTAGAQASVELRLARRLDPATVRLVAALADTARRAGLPDEPLVDKALEGAAKRAEPARIVAAVRSLAGDLARARDALGPAATAEELAAGAGALRAGLSPEALAALRRGGRGRPVTIALVTATGLVARGVPADTAARAVTALAEQRGGDSLLADYQREVERDIAVGAPPAVAASVRLAGALDAAGVATVSIPTSGQLLRQAPQPKRRP